MALSQTGQAVPVSGNIGFSGSVDLNSTRAVTATEAVGWANTVVNADSGSFSSIAEGTAVALASPWSFNSGAVNSFWTVGGYTFNLTSSSIFSQTGRFVDIDLTGTVTGNGFDATAFTGTFQVGDPSANGMMRFTERFSFASSGGGTSTPDGGTTAILLGLACTSLAALKYKFA